MYVHVCHPVFVRIVYAHRQIHAYVCMIDFDSVFGPHIVLCCSQQRIQIFNNRATFGTYVHTLLNECINTHETEQFLSYMCICICICIPISVSICVTNIYVCVCVCLYVYHMCVCISICVYIHVYVWAYLYLYLYP